TDDVNMANATASRSCGRASLLGLAVPERDRQTKARGAWGRGRCERGLGRQWGRRWQHRGRGWRRVGRGRRPLGDHDLPGHPGVEAAVEAVRARSLEGEREVL